MPSRIIGAVAVLILVAGVVLLAVAHGILALVAGGALVGVAGIALSRSLFCSSAKERNAIASDIHGDSANGVRMIEGLGSWGR
jgi:hypothetical protein